MNVDRNKLIISWLITIFTTVALTVVGFTMAQKTRPAPILIVPPEPTSMPEPTATQGPIQVFVNGAVAAPAVYELAAGSRVGHAIEVAGGFGVEANTTVVNLAQPLTDGAQVYVPSQEEEVVMPAVVVESRTNSVDILEESAVTNNGGLVNINTATVEELDILPGIGPSTAQKILDYRDENGRFKTIEELMNVSGIGEAKFNNVKDLITVGENT